MSCVTLTKSKGRYRKMGSKNIIIGVPLACLVTMLMLRGINFPYIPQSTLLTLKAVYSTGNPTSNYVCSKVIPCVVWMLWDIGWDTVPPMQALCRHSWIMRNPNYIVKALNLSEAEHLINRSQYYSDDAWKTSTIQAKSDVIRVELLSRYGGVWADATVHCNYPLDTWIDQVLGSERLFAYERHDRDVNNHTRPWISSWFLAAASDSEMLTTWVQHVRKAWSRPPYPPTTYGYFWFHRIFTYLVRNQTDFGRRYENMYHLDAGGPHCFFPDQPKPYVYKLKVCQRITDKLIGQFVNGTYDKKTA